MTTPSTKPSTKIGELLTEAEFAAVTRKDDTKASLIVLFDWCSIVALFWLAAVFPNPLTWLVVIILLGGRQMAFGVLVHETGHRSLFTSDAVNQFVGTWLSGYWVFSDKDAYMRGHLMHHKDCGTRDDPDLKNYLAYPVPHSSLKRKFVRDLTGQLGWRRLKSIGRSLLQLDQLQPCARQTIIGGFCCNLGLLLVLTLSGHPALYLLWVIAFMTSHMMIVRIRQIAEHAAVPDHFSDDPRLNTRTIYINALESLLVAPHGLNFHLEHHLMASVPIYRLKSLHQMLLAKNYYEGMEFPRGYFNLLKQATVPT